MSHSWLAFIGAKEGGSKNGVNFGIFKNYSGGPRGGQSRGYIPVTPDYIDIKFAGYVDTLSGCCREFSKSGVTLKCGPQEGSNFQAGSDCGNSGGQIHANIATLLRTFGRRLNPLKNAPYPGHHPLTQFVQGGLEDCNFC